jgi:hypothetical protein
VIESLAFAFLNLNHSNMGCLNQSVLLEMVFELHYITYEVVKLFIVHLVAQLVEALCYKPKGHGFDSGSHWIFAIDLILPDALWSWG